MKILTAILLTSIICESCSNEEPSLVKKWRKEILISDADEPFSYLVGKPNFIDKTLLIKEIVTDVNTRILITLPRRFGKSVNLNMLKNFLQITLDEECNEIPAEKNTTLPFELFIRSETKISKEKHIVQEYMGRYPVIFVNLFAVRGKTYQQFLTDMKHTLHNVHMDYAQLFRVLLKNLLKKEAGKPIEIVDNGIDSMLNTIKQHKITLPDSLQYFRIFYQNEGNDSTEDDVINCLLRLCETLYTHFGKRVYLLVDEYDYPLRNAMQISTETTTRQVYRLFESIFARTLSEGSKYIKQCIMTGITSVVRLSEESFLDNTVEYKFLHNHRYKDYYGFSQAEVDKLLSNFVVDEKNRELVRVWYDGYVAEGASDTAIYNPFDIAKFLRFGRVEGHWDNSGCVDVTAYTMKNAYIRGNFTRLCEGKEITFQLRNVSKGLEDLGYVHTFYFGGSMPRNRTDHFFSILFELGYLTCSGSESNSYRIPNYEIRRSFVRDLFLRYNETERFNEEAKERATEELSLLYNSTTYTKVNNFQKHLSTILAPGRKCTSQTAGIKKLYENVGVDFSNECFQVVISNMCLELLGFQKLSIERLLRKDVVARKIDNLLINEGLNMALIVEMDYWNGNSTTAHDRAVSYGSTVLNIFKKLKHIKYVGIHFQENNAVQVKCSVQHL